MWQLNDIWPGTSWALVDVEWQRKASFYITKRALAKVVVGMERLVTGKVPYMVTSYAAEKGKLEIWGVSGSVHEVEATLKLSAFDIRSGKEVELPEKERLRSVKLKPNQTTEITKIDIPKAEKTVVVAYLDDEKSGERLARWISWPEPLKFVKFKKDLKVEAKVEGETVVLKSNAPIPGVVVSVPIEEGEDAVWHDNFIDLVPGEEVKIGVKGLKGRSIQKRFLCDWEYEKGFEL